MPPKSSSPASAGRPTLASAAPASSGVAAASASHGDAAPSAIKGHTRRSSHRFVPQASGRRDARPAPSGWSAEGSAALRTPFPIRAMRFILQAWSLRSMRLAATRERPLLRGLWCSSGRRCLEGSAPRPHHRGLVRRARSGRRGRHGAGVSSRAEDAGPHRRDQGHPPAPARRMSSQSRASTTRRARRAG